jgi:hypothetical protein
MGKSLQTGQIEDSQLMKNLSKNHFQCLALKAG